MPIPLIIPLAVGLGGYLAANRIRKCVLKVAILGPEESGKSTLIELLKNGSVKESNYKHTGLREAVPEFEAFWTKNRKIRGTYITVNSESGIIEKLSDLIPDFGNLNKDKGQDVSGGSESMFRYKQLMRGKDFIFFLINAEKFLTDECERRDVFSRLDFIHNNRVYKGELIILATHVDKVQHDINTIHSLLKNTVKDKPYSVIFENIKCINLFEKCAGIQIQKCFKLKENE